MTLVAGIFARHASDPIPPAAPDALRRAISRQPDERIDCALDARACIVHVDVGAYGEPGWLRGEDGTLSAITGDPLLGERDSTAPGDRGADLSRLHREWRERSCASLAAAQGTFSGVHYDPAGGRLTLVTDKVGVRPLYYWMDDRYVVFASTLRALEELPFVPRTMDVRGVTELIALGFPLAERTPYVGIALLRAGEMLEVSGEGASLRRYWRWDDVAPSAAPLTDQARALHESYMRGVARRLRGDRTTAAFLSGGLDSRVVVAALHALGARTYSYNFALPGTQDQIFGDAFARRIGTVHTEAPMRPGNPKWSMMMAEAWTATLRRDSPRVEHPGLVWSGDGGSVGLGHVYMDRQIVEHMRAGALDRAITRFIEKQGAIVPRRLLRPEVVGEIEPMVRQGIREELEGMHCADAGRSFYLFLMHNDQRRHLAEHFETMDLHRLEFHLPFFDGAFLEGVVASPVDACLGHGLYMEWLAHFGTDVTAVPWQAYPGHVPCPLPVPDGLGTQWSEAQIAAMQTARREELLRQTAGMLRSGDFPSPLLRRFVLRAATLAHRSGVRDYRHVLKAAVLYHRYWSASAGRYHLSPVPSRPAS